jgi:hypothetical protein
MARDGQVCTPLGTLVRNRLTALETLNNSALVKRDTSSKAVTNFLVPPPPPPELHRRWKNWNNRWAAVQVDRSIVHTTCCRLCVAPLARWAPKTRRQRSLHTKTAIMRRGGGVGAVQVVQAAGGPAGLVRAAAGGEVICMPTCSFCMEDHE